MNTLLMDSARVTSQPFSAPALGRRYPADALPRSLHSIPAQDVFIRLSGPHFGQAKPEPSQEDNLNWKKLNPNWKSSKSFRRGTAAVAVALAELGALLVLPETSLGVKAALMGSSAVIGRLGFYAALYGLYGADKAGILIHRAKASVKKRFQRKGNPSADAS